MKWTWPFVSRRRHEAETAFLRADRDRVANERKQFEQDRDVQMRRAQTAESHYLAAGGVIACLEQKLAVALKQLAERGDPADMVPRADFEAEKKRADQLQARHDQAMGLDAAAVKAGDAWQSRREQKMRYDA